MLVILLSCEKLLGNITEQLLKLYMPEKTGYFIKLENKRYLFHSVESYKNFMFNKKKTEKAMDYFMFRKMKLRISSK